jgi:hypothetical protein
MTATAGRRERPRYGIDAPGVIAGFLLGGGVGAAAAGFALGDGAAATWRPALSALLTTGAIFAVEGLLMLAYSLAGKYRHRDRMLAAIEWRGDGRVLDVATGRGLLANGAARRGRASKSSASTSGAPRI